MDIALICAIFAGAFILSYTISTIGLDIVKEMKERNYLLKSIQIKRAEKEKLKDLRGRF